jgi:ribonuclease HI
MVAGFGDIVQSKYIMTLTVSTKIYTDGSCSTRFRAGAWVSILLIDGGMIRLNGTGTNTTHHRMELTAVIKALEYLQAHHKEIIAIELCSDSQFVLGLLNRKDRLTSSGFTNKAGRALPNADLIKTFFELSARFSIESTKIKAHATRNDSNQFNIEADMQSRKMVREWVRNLTLPHQS